MEHNEYLIRVSGCELESVESMRGRRPDIIETIFILAKEDVIGCAAEMGIPAEAITDDVLYQVKKGVEWGLESWSEVMKVAIDVALKS